MKLHNHHLLFVNYRLSSKLSSGDIIKLLKENMLVKKEPNPFSVSFVGSYYYQQNYIYKDKMQGNFKITKMTKYGRDFFVNRDVFIACIIIKGVIISHASDTEIQMQMEYTRRSRGFFIFYLGFAGFMSLISFINMIKPDKAFPPLLSIIPPLLFIFGILFAIVWFKTQTNESKEFFKTLFKGTEISPLVVFSGSTTNKE